MKLRWSLSEITLFTVAALLPTYRIRFSVGTVPMTVLEIVLLIAIGVFIFNLLSSSGLLNVTPAKAGVQKEKKVLDSRLRGNDKLIALGSLIIIVASVVNIIIAPDHRAALGIAKAYFWEPMLLAWLIIFSKRNTDSARTISALIYGFAVSALAVIVFGFVQYAFPYLIPAPWNTERRITSVFDFPNATALYLAPLLPLFLTRFSTRILAPLGLVTIVLARSAGGLIASAASIGFMGLTQKKWRVPTLVVGALIALVVMFAPQASSLREQILLKDWSGKVHMIGWKESLAMLKDHALFGAGLSGFPTAVIPYHHAQGVEIFQYPHNFFLATWSELGLLGVIGFVIIIIWFFRFKIQDSRFKIQHTALMAAMIAILVHGLVDVPYFKNDLAVMFWLFIAMMAIMRDTYDAERTTN